MIPNRLSIEKRPKFVDKRVRYGDFEGDLILGKNHKGAMLTLVERKREGKTYLLVPLTKNHTFKCNGDSLEVDGKIIPSKVFFRKDACQWIEIDEETLSKVA